MSTVTITLAKALKLKNRLASRLKEAEEQVTSYNSLLLEQVGKTGVDVDQQFRLRGQIANALVDVKVAIHGGNTGVFRQIQELAEAKSAVAFLKRIPTHSGTQRHSYQATAIEYVATITHANRQELVRGVEAEIDRLQDAIDAYNQNTKVSVPQAALDLAS